MPAVRPLPISLAFLVAFFPLAPCLASQSSGGRIPDLPTRIPVDRGVVIAHGNELHPPFMLTVEDDTLRVYDCDGRRFSSPCFADPGSARDPDLRVPRLLTHPALATGGAHPDHGEGWAQDSRTAIQMSQAAHLLSRGGLLVFGKSYALVLPPAAAGAALRELRWVVAHSMQLTHLLLHGSPLLKDLLLPLPLSQVPVGIGPPGTGNQG